MTIPCKLPILKNISYLSGIMFTFSIFIPLLSETSSTVRYQFINNTFDNWNDHIIWNWYENSKETSKEKEDCFNL